MRFSSFIEAGYLKAAEYGREARAMKIENIREIESPFQDEKGKTRLAVDFVDAESSEVLAPLLPNRTQLRSFIELFGNDVAAAIGQTVLLGVADTRFQGKTVPTFTIERYNPPLRAVKRRQGPALPDDPIPF